MGEGSGAAGSPLDGEPRDVEEIREDIEQTRAQMGDTVAELVAKTDLRARARAQLATVRSRAPGIVRAQGMRLVREARANPAGASAIALPLAGVLVWRRRRRRRR